MQHFSSDITYVVVFCLTNFVSLLPETISITDVLALYMYKYIEILN